MSRINKNTQKKKIKNDGDQKSKTFNHKNYNYSEGKNDDITHTYCSSNDIDYNYQRYHYKEKIEGIFGFKNFINYKLSNNCFMNSSLQNLLHCEKFVRLFHSISTKLNNKHLAKAFNALIEQMNQGDDELDASSIKEELANVEEKYKYNEQNDANEFISIFLNQLLVELEGFGKYETKNIPKDPLEKKAFTKLENKFFLKNKSFLLDLFYGRIKRDYICEKGHTCCVKFNNYNTLILPQPTELKNNIVDLLNSYQSEKEIDDTIACPKCEKEMKYKIKTSIYSIPDYFILCLEKEKLYSNSRLNYTQELDCISFMENNNDTYKLNSLISYSGNRLTGHYIAKCRYKDFWYCMNDSFYRKINDSEIDDRNAIILFYEKI